MKFLKFFICAYFFVICNISIYSNVARFYVFNGLEQDIDIKLSDLEMGSFHQGSILEIGSHKESITLVTTENSQKTGEFSFGEYTYTFPMYYETDFFIYITFNEKEQRAEHRQFGLNDIREVLELLEKEKIINSADAVLKNYSDNIAIIKKVLNHLILKKELEVINERLSEEL